MQSQKTVALVTLMLAVGLSSLAASCSGPSTASVNPGESTRAASDNYVFNFVMSPGLGDPPLGTYYVVSIGSEPDGTEIYEVTTPGEPITNYTEYPIEGQGPLGNGKYSMRVFDPMEYIWDTREDFFYVDGL